MVISARQTFVQTGTATAVALLLGTWASPATAFISGIIQDSGPSVHQAPSTPRPLSKASRQPRPTLAAVTRSIDKPAADKPAADRTAAAKPATSTKGWAGKASGPLQIIVSLDKQQLTLYSDGERIGRTRISSGQRSHPTPTGVFSVIQKNRWHRSNLYDDAPMFYMHRLTWSGIALHQGVVPNRPASHGCIRMPEAFAKNLWAISKMGARVLVTRGDVTPVEISHPRLFVPKHEPSLSMKPQIDALRSAPQSWTFAQLTSAAPLLSDAPTELPPLGDPAPAPELSNAPPSLITKPLKSGPVSVFISRKEGKLFVRKGFDPVFDVPVTFEQPDQLLGTHVYTALAINDDNTTFRWNVMSMPGGATPAKKADKKAEKGKKVEVATGPASTATQALDRVNIPPEAIERISELMSPGSSLIISDKGLGGETGKGTDFIVLTR
jgi:lipoprotein-anchoring transpeptidase ErfK/SrfK